MKKTAGILLVLVLLFFCQYARTENGYRLWLRYDVISDSQLLNEYNKKITGYSVQGESPVIVAAAKVLQSGLNETEGLY